MLRVSGEPKQAHPLDMYQAALDDYIWNGTLDGL